MKQVHGGAIEKTYFRLLGNFPYQSDRRGRRRRAAATGGRQGMPQRAMLELGLKLIRSDGRRSLHCPPRYSHPELPIAAMEHGLHVLAEKPVDVTASAAQRMSDAASQHRSLFLALCEDWRANMPQQFNIGGHVNIHDFRSVKWKYIAVLAMALSLMTVGSSAVRASGVPTDPKPALDFIRQHEPPEFRPGHALPTLIRGDLLK